LESVKYKEVLETRAGNKSLFVVLDN